MRFQKALELANQKEQEDEEDEELNAIQSEVLDRCAQIVEIIERIDRNMAQDENLGMLKISIDENHFTQN